jgi:YfiR/HmsC-like
MARRAFGKRKAVELCTWGVAAILICGLILLRPTAVPCEQVTGPEYEVKLGFIYNFANFVTWPHEAFKNAPGALTLCFASDDPSSDVLYKLDGKHIKGRKIKVMAYQEDVCVEQSQIIFFGTQDKTFIQKVLELVKGKSILTIGEVDGFTSMGGIIDFFEEHNRLRFKVNLDAAQRAGLKMSSQLLVSAQIVNEEHK